MTEIFLTDEELMLKNTVREFADDVLAPRAADYDESGEFPWDNVRELAGLGLFHLKPEGRVVGDKLLPKRPVHKIPEVLRHLPGTVNRTLSAQGVVELLGSLRCDGLQLRRPEHSADDLRGVLKLFLPPHRLVQKLGACHQVKP